jgi:gliding motility-associated-like protein
MTGKLSCNIKCIVLSLLILSTFESSLLAQVSSLGGIINKYGRVTSIGTDNVVISDPTQFSYFSTGDTVLLIQMKGAECLVPESGGYGDYQISVGTTGAYEFLTVLSVGAGNKITFRNNIIKTYSADGDVQLVRVPSRNAAKVDAELTCQAWDSITKIGGVVALIVGTKLTLNANINAKGAGFRGGSAALGLGNCTISGGGLNNFSYPESWQNSGLKGESQIFKAYLGSVQNPIFPGYAKGSGANFTGGGGGNGRFSGGGGGALVGQGGKGGKESTSCGTVSEREFGGVGGKSVSSVLPAGGLLLGGGGGGSTYLSGATPSSGGKGGGIIVIVCETLDGNGHTIIADGEKPSAASGNTGAGGGGGGGTIALYLQSFLTNVDLAVRGGAGGDNGSVFGEGGGGGGGRITTNAAAGPGTGNSLITGGTWGARSNLGHDALGGDPGESLTTFVPLLNGFLFNSIYSSVTKTQTDSICSNTYMGQMSGTNPIGGTLPYTYLWEYSVTSGTAGFSPAPGTNNASTYTPPAYLIQTTWFRRTVTDASTTPIVDISKPVKIIVHQAITFNLVGYITSDTTICYNQNPNKISPLNSGPSNGNGHYAYQWFSNTDNTTWTTNASGTSTLSSYDPAALLLTSYYQRKVTSGRCVDNSATVTITVLPSITGNVTIRSDSVICEGSSFDVLNASAASYGSGSYIYEWQESTDNLTWPAATGTYTNTTYSPDISDFTTIENIYYRRVVYSGLSNTCKSISGPIHLTRYHKIIDNTISADQTICSGHTPATLNGVQPTQGDHINYPYQWQYSTKTTTWTTLSAVNLNSYSPGVLADTTWYRRIVSSSKCTSTSNEIIVNVLDPVTNFNIAGDTTICTGAVPQKLRGRKASGGNGSFAYQWYYSHDNFVSPKTPVPVTGTLEVLTPVALTQDTWYMREVTSDECFETSNIIKVTVLPVISNNVITPANPAVCDNTIPSAITSGTLTGGSGTYTYLWESSVTSASAGFSTAAGTNNQANYTPPALTVKTWFRRKVNSGLNNCCTDISNAISIDILPLPTGIMTSIADTTICSGGQVKLRITLTGSSPWTVVYNEEAAPVTVTGISSLKAVISRIPVPSASSDFTIFNYSLASVTDNNGCVATSLSGTRKATVYHTPVAYAGPDHKICGRVVTLAAVKSYGTGLWTFPSRAHSADPTIPKAVMSLDSFNTAMDTVTFFWRETNWTCTSMDAVKITFDNHPDNVNAGTSGDIMTFDNSTLVHASPILSFETGTWTVVSGDGYPVDEHSDSTYMRNIAIGGNIYKWTVTNDTCSLSDTVRFIVSHPVIPEGISPNGDMINDTLNISGIDFNVQEADLKILNSAGTLVFSTSHRKKQDKWVYWDGKDSKGAMLPEGTYYYLLNVYTADTGHVSKVSGFIILKRH